MMKKKSFVFCIALAAAVCAGVIAAPADEAGDETVKVIQSMPSPGIASLIAGKTLDVRLTGYGWGETVDSLSLDFTVTEPAIFPASDIEDIKEGEVISTGMEGYTVTSVEKTEDAVTVVPEEEWLTPITLTQNDDGNYQAENEEGVLMIDSFSFSARISADLAYINTEGDTLTAEELMQDLSEGMLDTDSIQPKAAFDEQGYLVELNFAG